MADRDERGRFIPGNTAAKLDFTKEKAKFAISKNIQWTAKMLTEISTEELNEIIADGSLDKEAPLVSMLIKSAMSGDIKSLTWLVELINGKAIQQVETKITEHAIQINVDSDDAQL